ncbi:hypothetical protein RJT34_22682 [Clitoria ternatea]|uniref:Uncharacterized protein n=1 Tax=Clitoria ternatea TaxID=43366 RepID=A0AAN9FJK4_CLITE
MRGTLKNIHLCRTILLECTKTKGDVALLPVSSPMLHDIRMTSQDLTSVEKANIKSDSGASGQLASD